MSGKQLKDLEDHFPTLSGKAFDEARQQVLKSGQSILIARDGIIFERFPDGKEVERKRVTPPRKVVKGSILRIKKG